ncbi:glycerophosphodiester phosphodiesterase family protein [Frigidibacter sp. ROC022]|uniref:glycerophosphodiester phosphodiesterase family protein n=1 Tax=Frigidibacter sp. ROC022 TaxID=2971796 RepID=UPI00215A8C73|nr:glycerophosphodiester phosphodiesterase family protein [Frigidibacter sp. ROC022]MCR8724864.1 phosphodiesterase [Frigidibacter sp. ROC022]
MTQLDPAFLGPPIAHRAYHDPEAGRPENSLAAVRAAIAAGYGIEIDVQPSSDGVAMVFHDNDLERLTGRKGPVTGLDAATLGQLKILGSEERVPTLAQVLDEVAGRVPLLIEVKDQSHALKPVDGRLEETVAETLAGYSGPVALMSFNPYSVAHLARLAPDIPRGLTTCGYAESWWNRMPEEERLRLRGIPDYGPTGASFISHEASDLARPRVAELKAEGAAVLCWTIRSPVVEAEARRIADNVTFEGYAAAIPGQVVP